ncbi:hypothetical protein [Enterococcus faecalis]|uniref:hypothetical protein n=1 Tax=Enterococcus faecalis TaxID=1351 RepID=UPI00287F8ACB|nr:hypothetical protein [Enterococcus faecalis]
MFFYYSTLFDSRFKTLQQNRNEDTERFKRIQELAKKIETASTRQFSSHISKERFEAYQRMGLQFKEIAEEFNITTTALQQWRKDNGYPIYNKNNRK